MMTVIHQIISDENQIELGRSTAIIDQADLHQQLQHAHNNAMMDTLLHQSNVKMAMEATEMDAHLLVRLKLDGLALITLP